MGPLGFWAMAVTDATILGGIRTALFATSAGARENA